MVVCRCGCEFQNFRMNSHVVCPECGRIYPNEAPDMYHPKTEDELRWKCERCGTINSNSYQGGPRKSCEKCNAARPGCDLDTNKKVVKQNIIGEFLKGFFQRYTK